MFDVLTYLFERFQELDDFPSRQSISEMLIEGGFDRENIIKALICLDELFPAHQEEAIFKESSSQSMRIFNDYEKKLFPTEVQGLIHFLEKKNGISEKEREDVIQALSKLPPEDINIETTKMIVLVLAWSRQSEIPILIGDELLTVFNPHTLKN